MCPFRMCWGLKFLGENASSETLAGVILVLSTAAVVGRAELPKQTRSLRE